MELEQYDTILNGIQQLEEKNDKAKASIAKKQREVIETDKFILALRELIEAPTPEKPQQKSLF